VSALSSPPVVTIKGVGYTYPSGTVALHDCALSLVRGEVLSIVGPSGCGKSTLLRIIAGLTEPTIGSVANAPDLDGRCARTMVFQTDTLLPWLTVSDNAALYAKFQSARDKKASAQKRAGAISELLSLVGLTGFAKAFPYQLSGGMKRRLAFVAGAAPAPAMLLLDEPFASVDEPTRIQIHQDVLRIIRKLNTTVVLVTHDLAEAASLSDRVLIMTGRPGRIFREHQVVFGPERDMLSLRQSREFLDLYGVLWHDLSEQMKNH
jgi:sulfonate transport system ATP-binding protein